MQAWYVFERIEGRGNPWSIMRPGALDERDRAKSCLKYASRIVGREARMLKLENLRWTPEDILGLVERGMLPR